MEWDFQTEPEFQEQLDWTARFVREEIWPIEPIADELDQAALERIYAPLQQQVKARGLWAAHLDPEPHATSSVRSSKPSRPTHSAAP
jgi:acyl-CoA dehydrogenase